MGGHPPITVKKDVIRIHRAERRDMFEGRGTAVSAIRPWPAERDRGSSFGSQRKGFPFSSEARAQSSCMNESPSPIAWWNANAMHDKPPVLLWQSKKKSKSQMTSGKKRKRGAPNQVDTPQRSREIKIGIQNRLPETITFSIIAHLFFDNVILWIKSSFLRRQGRQENECGEVNWKNQWMHLPFTFSGQQWAKAVKLRETVLAPLLQPVDFRGLINGENSESNWLRRVWAGRSCLKHAAWQCAHQALLLIVRRSREIPRACSSKSTCKQQQENQQKRHENGRERGKKENTKTEKEITLSPSFLIIVLFFRSLLGQCWTDQQSVQEHQSKIHQEEDKYDGNLWSQSCVQAQQKYQRTQLHTKKAKMWIAHSETVKQTTEASMIRMEQVSHHAREQAWKECTEFLRWHRKLSQLQQQAKTKLIYYWSSTIRKLSLFLFLFHSLLNQSINQAERERTYKFSQNGSNCDKEEAKAEASCWVVFLLPCLSASIQSVWISRFAWLIWLSPLQSLASVCYSFLSFSSFPLLFLPQSWFPLVWFFVCFEFSLACCSSDRVGSMNHIINSFNVLFPTMTETETKTEIKQDRRKQRERNRTFIQFEFLPTSSLLFALLIALPCIFVAGSSISPHFHVHRYWGYWCWGNTAKPDHWNRSGSTVVAGQFKFHLQSWSSTWRRTHPWWIITEKIIEHNSSTIVCLHILSHEIKSFLLCWFEVASQRNACVGLNKTPINLSAHLPVFPQPLTLTCITSLLFMVTLTALFPIIFLTHFFSLSSCLSM